MSVILFEPALRALLDSQFGAVANYTRAAAEIVTQQATLNADHSGIDTLGIKTGATHSGIRFEMHSAPVEATVGTDANKDGFSYPAWWDLEGGKPWLFNALQVLEAFGWEVSR